jgi:hypothetical protein
LVGILTTEASEYVIWGYAEDATMLLLDTLERADTQKPISIRRFTYEPGFGLLKSEYYQCVRKLDMLVATNPTLANYAATRTSEMRQAMEGFRISRAGSFSDVMEWTILERGLPKSS